MSNPFDVNYYLNLPAEEDEALGEGGRGFRSSVEYANDVVRSYSGTLQPQEEYATAEQVAEVILVGTSLGSIRRQFFSSARARSFLFCKGIAYYFIDSNRDQSVAKDLLDNQLYQEWKANNILATVDSDTKRGKEVSIPQVLIDGVSIGGERELQDLEEDGDLDWIFARLVCPICLEQKESTDSSCPSCHANFTNLISEQMNNDGSVQLFIQDQLCNGNATQQDEETQSFHSATTFSAGTFHGGVEKRMTFNYEDVFGEPP